MPTCIEPNSSESIAQTSPADAAREAGLRYVSDDQPGIRRQRAGRGFSYRHPDGRLVREPAELRRIRALAIPPAWREVWICPWPNGHIQATARDAKGRKQYRYHARWREERDAAKYGRLAAFAEALPAIRAQVEADLASPGLSREKLLAALVRLLETTRMRIGNEAYVRTNRSFGLTTLRSRHVAVNGSELRFKFRGKSGREHLIRIADRRLARVVRRCQELPGQLLFQYRDEQGELRPIASDDVNAYLRETVGQEYSAKDFRTWAGTVLAAEHLLAAGPPDDERTAKQRIVEAIDAVAGQLGNTRAVCRACYVHPAVLDAYADGRLFATAAAEQPGPADDPRALDLEERLVLALLYSEAGGQGGSGAEPRAGAA